MVKKNIELLPERLKMEPCPIGKNGFCCKTCLMGPCRIMSHNQKGVCGASQDLVAARNILRFTAGGTAAHCGHSYHLLKYLGKKYSKNYIKHKAPPYLYKLWKELDIVPEITLEHFKDISEAMHVSTMGVNADYQDVLKWCMRLGIIDGYYGLYLATELEDKKFGKPKIRKGEMDLSCIDPKKINIAVHGHEPMLAEALVIEVKKNNNINLVGVCCTGAALLSRHGIPIAAHFVLQENVITTGIIDAIVVDTQCIMPSLSDLCDCYHTKLITTNEIARIPNALHMPVTNLHSARVAARNIIKEAVANKNHRGKNINIQSERKRVVIGFTEDNIDTNKLADMIQSKNIKGIIAVIGCVNPRVDCDAWIKTFERLSKDYIIFTTGCVAFEFGSRGLLDGERFFHLGSCVNNARIAEIFKRIADKFNKKITDMLFLVSCPMPMSEKSIAIGFFFASLGVDVHYGYPFLISSDTHVSGFLENVLKNKFKSRVFMDVDPESFYRKIAFVI